jgi:hypothetical protein
LAKVVDLAQPKNISRKEHPHRDLSTTLRFGRDDKGKRALPEEKRLANRKPFPSRG